MEIILRNVSYNYMEGTPFEKKAIDNINLSIASGTITGIIGPTGSGKSTLVQIIAGLILPTRGTVKIDGLEWTKKKDSLELRSSIGISFQYPEHQIFAETVEKDVAFGPKNFGMSEESIIKNVKEALEKVKLSFEDFGQVSPFKLSGGQMKKVALAGIFAYKPKILILDEPTAGLDPISKKEFHDLIKELNKNNKITILIVSHNMDEVASISNKIIVLSKGKIMIEGAPEDIFQMDVLLQKVGLDIPNITKLIKNLNQKIEPPIPLNCFSINELEKYLVNRLKGD